MEAPKEMSAEKPKNVDEKTKAQELALKTKMDKMVDFMQVPKMPESK